MLICILHMFSLNTDHTKYIINIRLQISLHTCLGKDLGLKGWMFARVCCQQLKLIGQYLFIFVWDISIISYFALESLSCDKASTEQHG